MMLNSARQPLVIQSQPVVREFEMKDGEIASVRVPVLAWDALMASKEERDL